MRTRWMEGCFISIPLTSYDILTSKTCFFDNKDTSWKLWGSLSFVMASVQPRSTYSAMQENSLSVETSPGYSLLPPECHSICGHISLTLVPCPAGCKESFLNQIFVISLQHLSGNEKPAFGDFECLTLLWTVLVCLQSDRSVIFRTTRRAQSLQRHERSKQEATSLSKASLCEPEVAWCAKRRLGICILAIHEVPHRITSFHSQC